MHQGLVCAIQTCVFYFNKDYNNWLDDPRREWHLPSVLPPIRSDSPTLERESHTHVPPPTQAFNSDFNSPRTYASTYDLVNKC